MKKRFAIILTAAALSMTGCSLLGQDTYYIDQGMEQINSGNYEEALTSFSSAEQEGKHLVESYRGSGMAYMALGEYDKAVEAFDRASIIFNFFRFPISIEWINICITNPSR